MSKIIVLLMMLIFAQSWRGYTKESLQSNASEVPMVWVGSVDEVIDFPARAFFGIGTILGFVICWFWLRSRNRFKRATRESDSNIYSPEDLSSDEKVSFLISRLEWVRRQQMVSENHWKKMKPRILSFDRDFRIQFDFDDCQIHLLGSKVSAGYVVELATDSREQQGARYLEDLGTIVTTGLFSIFRAELSVEEFKKIEGRLKEIWEG